MKPILTLLAPVFLWALFSAFFLFQWGIWNDEGYTYLIAQMHSHELKTALGEFIFAPPLWYHLNRFSLWIWGDSVFGLRFIPWIASLASLTILQLRWTANAPTGQRWLIPTLWFSSNFILFYASEARNYSLFAFLYLLCLVWTDSFFKNQKRLALFGLILTETFLLYLHNYAPIFILSIQIYAIYFLIRNQTLWRRWIGAQAIAFLFYSPWLWSLFNQYKQIQGRSVLSIVWEKFNFLTAPTHSLLNLIPGASSPKSMVLLPSSPLFLSLVLFCGLIIASFWLPKNSTSWSSFKKTSLFIWLPIFFLSIFSDWAQPVYIVGRTEALVVPLFIMCLFLILRQAPRILQIGWVGLALAISIWTLMSPGKPKTIIKAWDQTFAQRIQQSNPDTIFMDHQVAASIPTYLHFFGRDETIQWVLPKINHDSVVENTFGYLKARQTQSQESGFLHENFLESIQKNQPKTLAILSTSKGKIDDIWKFSPWRNQLTQHLSSLNYQTQHPPFILPIDGMTGFHVLDLFILQSPMDSKPIGSGH